MTRWPSILMPDEEEEDELLEEDEYVEDRVCPKCGSRLCRDRVSGWIWCASMVCDYKEEPEE